MDGCSTLTGEERIGIYAAMAHSMAVARDEPAIEKSAWDEYAAETPEE